MQLIFETEASVNIAEKMTSVDAMSIAESKPDSQPEVNKVSKCNSIEINNIVADALKPIDNGTSEEQNGDANLAMMTELPEANDVVNKDKENDISAQNGNGDIASAAKVDTIKPVTSENTELEKPVRDSEISMQVENNLPRISEKLGMNADVILKPKYYIETKDNTIETNADEATKQQVANNNDNEVKMKSNEDDSSDLDITENISLRQENQNEITDTNIKESNVAESDTVTNNGVGCEAKFVNNYLPSVSPDCSGSTCDMGAVIDSNEAHSVNKELTENNQAEETKTFDCAEVKLKPKKFLEDKIKTTYCTEKGFNSADSSSDDKVVISEKLMESTDGTEIVKSNEEGEIEALDHEERINSTSKIEANKIEVIEKVLISTDETRENKIEAADSNEGIKPLDGTSENQIKATDHHEEIKYVEETEEHNMEVTDHDERINIVKTQENEIEAADNNEGIKPLDGTSENQIIATDHHEEIKSVEKTEEHNMELTDHEEKINIVETQENEMEVTDDVAEISSTDDTQENKMEVLDQEEKIKSIYEPQENITKSSDQFNSSEEKARSHSLPCEQSKVDDNNEESVINVNRDKLGSDANDECILNSSEEKNSVKECKENFVEQINPIESIDNLKNANNVNNDTQQKTMNMCDSVKEDDVKTKDMGENKVDLPQPAEEKATALEPMDVDTTEDLSFDNPTVSDKSATPIDTIPDKAISEDIISLDSGKTVNLDSDRKSSPVTVIDCDEIQDIADEKSNNISHRNNTENKQAEQSENVDTKPKKSSSVCGLSNTLDILSDDDDCVEELPEKTKFAGNENKCINLDEDDDVMLIDDLPVEKELEEPKINDYMNTQESDSMNLKNKDRKETDQMNTINLDNDSEPEISKASTDDVCKDTVAVPLDEDLKIKDPEVSEKPEKPIVSPKVIQRPIIPENFLKSFRKNVVDMNRDELEEFCLMKIVEGIIDQTNLSEIKTKLKTMSSSVEEWKKKVVSLTKQNKDLQIVLRTVQDEQSKRSDQAVVPLKITRSVGMQVYMAEVTDRNAARRKPPQSLPAARNNLKSNTSAKPGGKPNSVSLPIPVPRLVPATNNSPMKARQSQQVQNATVSSNSPKQVQIAMKTPPSVKTEKRPFSSVQSVTVDLTDDEPPAKQPATARNNAQQAPVRLVAQQQLMKPRAQIALGNAAARKVFIPINPQNNMRPGQTITLKSVPNARVRGPGPQNGVPIRVQANSVRGPRPTSNIRHPAPLPEVAKQQQPPNWKALPPAPDLKISKVENGIVISWKIEGYQEDSYEEIASYQLYAYQETSSPPNTALWKKIGDVKALPLPMACTLTQFMAGYKYYFAVRAVDNRSRIGAFSLPGSILLLNK